MILVVGCKFAGEPIYTTVIPSPLSPVKLPRKAAHLRMGRFSMQTLLDSSLDRLRHEAIIRFAQARKERPWTTVANRLSGNVNHRQ